MNEDIVIFKAGLDIRGNNWTKKQIKNMYLPSECAIRNIENEIVGTAKNLRKDGDKVICDVEEIDTDKTSLTPMISYDNKDKEEILELLCLLCSDSHAFRDLEGNLES